MATQEQDQGLQSMMSFHNLKKGLCWILLVVSIIGYIFLYVVIPRYCSGNHETLREIVKTITDAVFIGGLAGVIIDTAQNLGLFKNELKSLLYGKDFLKIRSDSPQIWKDFTETLYAAKYENIPPRLVETLQELYLPDNPMYIANRSTSVRIEWGDKERTKIITRVVDVFTLVTNTIKEIDYDSTTSINTKDKKDAIKTSVLEYRVGGNALAVTTREDKDGPLEYPATSQTIKLSGSKKYTITKRVEQEYSFLDDYTYAMKARYPISDFTLDFIYPDDMQILFYDRGTLNGFEILTKETGHLVAKSNGLILKGQGYVIAMRETNNN